MTKNQEALCNLNNIINIIDDLYLSECNTNEGDFTSSIYFNLINSLNFIKEYLVFLEK